MKKKLLQTMTLIGTIILYSNVVIGAEAEHAQHPGGIFKQDPRTRGWAIQCQGCNSWLMSTYVSDEPVEKNVSFSSPQITPTHKISCKWLPSPKENKESKKEAEAGEKPKEVAKEKEAEKDQDKL